MLKLFKGLITKKKKTIINLWIHILEMVSVAPINIPCVLIKALYAFVSECVFSSVKKLALNAVYPQQRCTSFKIQSHCVKSSDSTYSDL